MSENQTYTPSNGAMILCSEGTGDYVKKIDHNSAIASLREEVTETNRQMAAVQYQSLQIAGERDTLRNRVKELERDLTAHKDVGESLMKEVKRLDKELAEARGKL